jgi:hypothetical protein
MKIASSVKPKPSVVVFVADVRRVSTFYRELASMSVLIEDEGYAVMEAEGFQLVIHRLSGEPRVSPSAISVREDSYVKLCLPVASITAARALAAANGGESSLPSTSGRRAGSAHATVTIPKAM